MSARFHAHRLAPAQTAETSRQAEERKAIEMIFKRIEALLKNCETDFPVMPPTQLYNEGWMLRLTIDRFASICLENKLHPLAVPPGCRWYSEALLPSAFLPESRKDSLAESWTHADGVIGHFGIGNGAKGNLTLHSDAKHLVVLEAKMFSKLSANVKNASYFNQAARNVACIAEVLKRAERRAREFNALGFYVLAPASQIKQGLFDEHLTKASLRTVAERRVKEYGGKRDEWFSEWFLPVLERLDIKAVSWEELIGFLATRDPDADQLRDFYARCLEFNKHPKKAEQSVAPDRQ